MRVRGVCTVCSLPDAAREDVHRRLREGAPHAELAAAHGISKSAMGRHLRAHLPYADAMASLARDVAPLVPLLGQLDPGEGDTLTRLRAIGSRLATAYTIAERLGDLDILPRLAREQVRCVELEDAVTRRAGPAAGQGASDAEARGAVAALSAVILEALSEHPEARERVARALVGGGA